MSDILLCDSDITISQVVWNCWFFFINCEPNFMEHVTWQWHRLYHLIIYSVLFTFRLDHSVYKKMYITYNHKEVIMVFFVVLFFPCALSSFCSKSDSCYYPETKPLNVPYLDITKQDIYPRSCTAICMLSDRCVGVTYDPLDETCHLYKQSASFGITQEPGVSLWLFQAPGVPCFKASQQ